MGPQAGPRRLIAARTGLMVSAVRELAEMHHRLVREKISQSAAQQLTFLECFHDPWPCRFPLAHFLNPFAASRLTARRPRLSNRHDRHVLDS